MAADPRDGLLVEHGEGECADVGCVERRGGDAVLADTHGGEKREKFGECQGDGGVAFENVKGRESLLADFGVENIASQGLNRLTSSFVFGSFGNGKDILQAY